MRASLGATAAAILCLGLACGRGNEAAKTAPVDAPAPVNGRIDPAPYRAEIEATEALLYASAPPTADDWKSLSRTLLELHNAIVFHDTSELARETSRKLFFLSARVDAEPAEHRSSDELVVMRGVWEKIRADQFASADWFHAASP
jgi:hypothetical protein